MLAIVIDSFEHLFLKALCIHQTEDQGHFCSEVDNFKAASLSSIHHQRLVKAYLTPHLCMVCFFTQAIFTNEVAEVYCLLN